MFFFCCENQKCAWNVFLGLFTHEKLLSRTLFWHFSLAVRMFHGNILGFFHVWAIYLHRQKIDIFENFHVWVSLFHTLKKAQELPTNQGNFQTRQFFFIMLTKVTISMWYFKLKILVFFFTYTQYNFHVHRWSEGNFHARTWELHGQFLRHFNVRVRIFM